MQQGLQALPLVFMMTTGAAYAVGQPATCYPIRHGETAAGLAQRLTGEPSDYRQPWFQILDPTTSAEVPKVRYGVLQSGWYVCVATEMVRRDSPTPVEPATGSSHDEAPIDSRLLWWATPVFVVVSGAAVVCALKLAAERRASLVVMKRFGDRFVFEFERPLLSGALNPPVESRLRFAPVQRRLEILIAPAGGRTYPNLSDHRKNVEYDVERVQRLLKDRSFVNGPPYETGRWVIIPFYFVTHKHEKVCREYSSSEFGRRRRQHSALG